MTARQVGGEKLRRRSSTFGRLAGKTEVVSEAKSYAYASANVRHRTNRPIAIHDGLRVLVDGELWRSVTDVTYFDDQARLAYRKRDGTGHAVRPAGTGQVLADAANSERAAELMFYWRAIVQANPARGSLRPIGPA